LSDSDANIELCLDMKQKSLKNIRKSMIKATCDGILFVYHFC